MTVETLPKKARASLLPSITPAVLGLGDQPAKAGPDDPAVAHLRAQLDAGVRELLDREPGTRSGTDPEDLHQMRVALRRIRSVLKMSGTLLGPTAELVRAELGWLGQSLGEVRDYDVLIDRLRAVAGDFEPRDQVAASELVAKFVADRALAKERLNKALSSARYATMLQRIGQLARQPDQEPELPASSESGADPAAETHDLVAGLRKPYRKLSKAVAALPEDPPDDELHALRIHGKRLRYAAELARRSVKKKRSAQITKLIEATKELQTVLGDHQDAVVAADRMRTILDVVDTRLGFIAGRIAEREWAKRAKARTDWPGIWAEVDAAARTVVTPGGP